MRRIIFIAKSLLLLVCFFAYFAMLHVLWCGCWACHAGAAIGIAGFVICAADRVGEYKRKT